MMEALGVGIVVGTVVFGMLILVDELITWLWED